MPLKSSTNAHPDDTCYAAIDARVSMEVSGKGFSFPMQIEACQVMAARAMEN
jgi:hypothetical protein